MYYGLYISAAGAHAQNQKVEVISNNLANVDTVGFKRELALLEARESEAIERGYVQPGTTALEDIGGGVRLMETATDFGVGTLKRTDMETDFALEVPNAFFTVQAEDEQLLTRAGNFVMAPDGRLLSAEGHPVLSTDGAPIQLEPGIPWRLLPGGRIQQAGATVDLGIRRPTSLRQLTKVGRNYYSAAATETQPVPADERRVRGGYLEMSGVNSMQEMVEMIATSRSYETNVRMIQNHDSMTGSLVSRMLRAA
jgi:flagellar basal-body rod protein FlgF/flagellar basal-body rod protein FlgG